MQLNKKLSYIQVEIRSLGIGYILNGWYNTYKLRKDL